MAALGAIRASSANKTPLIAIDLSQEHLDIVRENTPFADQTRLTTRCGRFPTEINFEDNSLSAFHAANIFHFLTGEEFELALAKAFKGLEPSGKIFTTVASIYSTRTDNFVEYYQRNLDKGIKWPGLVSDLRQFILNSGGVIDEENHMASNMVHFFRLQEYQKAVEAAGFIVEFCDYFDFENTGDEYERHPKSWITMVARKPQLMS
ncbi:MAG: class I SAM-dependent methyltransferase [Gammaproteobacteria bacterium]|nr:class I SAM-dependent methyltransferase [Gammaproteobacteria bacterium]